MQSMRCAIIMLCLQGNLEAEMIRSGVMERLAKLKSTSAAKRARSVIRQDDDDILGKDPTFLK